MHLDCKSVLAVGESVCDVKSVRAECVLAVADSLAVDVYIVSGLNTVEFEVNASARSLHCTVNSELFAVQSNRVIVCGSLWRRNVAVVF